MQSTHLLDVIVSETMFLRYLIISLPIKKIAEASAIFKLKLNKESEPMKRLCLNTFCLINKDSIEGKKIDVGTE